MSVCHRVKSAYSYWQSYEWYLCNVASLRSAPQLCWIACHVCLWGGGGGGLHREMSAVPGAVAPTRPSTGPPAAALPVVQGAEGAARRLGRGAPAAAEGRADGRRRQLPLCGQQRRREGRQPQRQAQVSSHSPFLCFSMTVIRPLSACPMSNCCESLQYAYSQ